MTAERTAINRITTEDPNEATTEADANLPYGYAGVDRTGESQSHRPSQSQFNGRPSLPHAAALTRDLPYRIRQHTHHLAAAAVNVTEASTQTSVPAPPHQQRETRVTLQSHVFMGHIAGDYLAHIQMSTDPNVNTMFPVKRPFVAPPPPQQMFKQDVDAAKILVAMSRKDWEEYRKNGGS